MTAPAHKPPAALPAKLALLRSVEELMEIFRWEEDRVRRVLRKVGHYKIPEVGICGDPEDIIAWMRSFRVPPEQTGAAAAAPARRRRGRARASSLTLVEPTSAELKRRYEF